MIVWHVDGLQAVTLLVIMSVGIVYFGVGLYQDRKRRKKKGHPYTYQGRTRD